MAATKIDLHTGASTASRLAVEHPLDPNRRDDELIRRAAKRADWAGTALEGAAGDLLEADIGGAALAGLTEVLLDEAGRVSRIAEDIESRRSGLEDLEPVRPRSAAPNCH